MTTPADIETALRRLREADPGRAVPPTEPTVVNAALRTTRDSAVVVAPGRRATLAIVLVAAAVALVAVVATVVLRPDHAAPPAVGGPSVEAPSPTAATLGHDDAVTAVGRLLGLVPTLPGGIRLAVAPTPGLQQPESRPATPNLVDRAAFWTAPGSVHDAAAFYTAHPAAGLAATGYGSTGPDDHSLLFGLPENGKAWIQVAIVSYRSGVAVRVDAMAIWVPTRPAATYLGTVQSVDVTVDRLGAAPQVHRTLTGAAAQHLAALIDALPVFIPGAYSCPVERGFTDVLVFHANGHLIHAVDRLDGCASVTVTVDSGQSIQLVDDINAAVTAALGLPARYGS